MTVFIGFGATFVLGVVLVAIGIGGISLTDCPPLIAQFPATSARCNLFPSLVGAGALLGFAGAAVASGMLVFGNPDSWGRVGRR